MHFTIALCNIMFLLYPYYTQCIEDKEFGVILTGVVASESKRKTKFQTFILFIHFSNELLFVFFNNEMKSKFHRNSETSLSYGEVWAYFALFAIYSPK
jgi:hypothetical protein